jgi:CBS-domain-containing membrane protein
VVGILRDRDVRMALAVAVAQLLNRGIGALPVIDPEGRLCGVLSYIDVIRALSVEPLVVAKA